MTFADLNLPQGYGHGVWSHTIPVTGDDWAAAEDTLATAAQAWIGDNPSRAGSYHVFQDDKRNMLTLDLMRGA